MVGASWLALEPRIMFDGAAVTTVDSVATEQLAKSQAESSLSPDDTTMAYSYAAPTGEPQFSSTDQALFDALAAYDTSAARQEIVFLSPSIRDYQRLLDNMSPNIEVFVLDPTREGMQQVTEALAGRAGIDALHLIAEGNEAELHLGTSVLTRDSLSTRYAEAFQQIGRSLSAEADVLIYGCNFGRGAAGQSAIDTLADFTGADVAASTDLTGAAGLGGDWTLEVDTGPIESAIAVTMEGRAAYSHVLDISSGLLGHWTFDTNADDSSGNNYNGTLTNGAAINTTSSTNIVGAGKVSLDGVNDFVNLTAHKANFEGLTQGTIAMWVRTTDAHMELFSLSDTADQNSLVALYVTSAGTLGFDVWQNDVNILDARSVTSINDGQWHHVAVTVDAGGTKLYVDGAEAQVNYEDGNSASTAFFDDVTEIDVMQIGRNTNNSGNRLHYDGLIDDVRVYNRVLTGGDIGELYDTGNVAPVIANLAGDSLAYSEGAGAVVLEQGGNATVSDVDSVDFTGGTLTVRFTAGSDSAEDVLAIRNQGAGAGQIGVSGSSVTYGGVTIGTFTGGSGGSNLVITLNSSATPTAATALVQNITYENTDTGAPTTGARTVRFVLTDGDGGTSANYNTTVTVSGVNDAPVISNLSGDSLAYSEGAGAVVIEQGGGAAVSDVDSANFNSGTLTVRFTAGSDSAEDVLSIRNQGTGAGQIGVSGSGVTYGGVTIGTFTGGSGGSNLVITFNSSATPTAVTALVKNITYQNTDTAIPTTGARTVRFVLTDGDGGTSTNYDTTVTVSGVNDAPVITNLSGDSVGYSEGAGAVILEQGGNATVSDVDSADFNTGTLTISFAAGSDSAEDVLSIRNQGAGAGQIGVSGSSVTYGGVTIGTVTGGSGGSNLVITLTSSATSTAVTALVKNLTYENTDTATPTIGVRAVRVVLTDGDGGTSADYDTTVTVSAVNDAPVNTVPGAQMMGEDGSLVFSAGTGNQISIVDADAAAGIMHITLTAANGKLTLNGTTGLSFITGDGTADGTMTFTGTVADINTALNGMNFLPALNYNGPASVQVTTDDQGNTGGAVQSDTDTVLMTVAAGNDPPVNTIPGPQGTPQNTNLVFSAGTGNQISIGDADVAGGIMHVTLAAANGTLTLNGTTGLSFITGDGAADATMTFTGTLADINTALNGMSFLPALNYNGAASVQVTADDQGNTGGGAQSDTDTVSIIVSNNVPPAVTMSGGSLSYTEDDGAVAIDTGLTVADADNATLAGATVRITGNYVNGEDLLAFTNQLGITGSWNAGTGELTLTGSATVGDYQTALRSITYTNLNHTPSTTARTVSFSVNDSAVDSAITTRMITIAAVDDPPTISNLSGDSLVYSEDDGAVVLEQGGNATVSDVDSAHFNTGTLTVSFVAGSDSTEDVLSIRNQGTGGSQIGVSGATVTYGGVTIGTFTGGSGGSNLVITLTGSATPTAVTALVKNLTYENTDTATPMIGARTVRVVLTDGDGGTSANYDTTVMVSAVDDAPVNTAPGAQSGNEDTSLSLAGISVNDVDENLSTVQLGVTNGTVNVTLQGAAMISAGSNGTNTLTLSGTQADINATLASLAYQGTLHYTGTDTLTITSTDSTGVTDIDTVAITVNAENDAPVNTAPGAQSVNEDTPLGLAGISVTDVDGNLSTVQLGVTNGAVTVTLQGAAMISAGGNGTDALTLSGTQGDINATLASLVYQGALHYTGADTLTITSTDNTGVTDIDTVAITVNAENDAPTITALADQTILEDGTTGQLGFTVSDVDTAAGGLSVTASSSNTAIVPNGNLTLVDLGGGNWTVTAVPALNQNGGPLTITVAVNDGAITTNETFDITVTAQNDSPVMATNNGSTVIQGGIDTITSAELQTIDVEHTPSQLTYAVAIAPGNGRLELSSAPGIAITSFTQAQINAGLVGYVHDGSQTANDGFTFTVTDGAGGNIGTTTFGITVTLFNSNPVLTVNAGSTAVQGLSDPITAEELRITDANNSPEQLIYTVRAAPTNGQLELTNDPGVAVTTFTQADIDAGRLVFVHSGAVTTSDSFTFTVSDGAGGSLGAITFRFDVAPFIPSPGSGGGHSGSGESSTGGSGITGSGSESGSGSGSKIANSGTVTPPPVQSPLELMRDEMPVKNVSVAGATQDPVPKAVFTNRLFARIDQPDPVIQEPPALLVEPLSIPVKKVLVVGHTLMEHLTKVADDLERGVQDRESQNRVAGRVASFSGMALSAGFVAWILRGGSLLASFLVSMPTWRHFDPLPVLGLDEGDRRKRDRKIREEDAQEKREFLGLDRVLKPSRNEDNRKRTGA